MNALQEINVDDADINLETFYRVFRDISTLVHASTSLKEVLDLVVTKSAAILNAKGALLRIRNLETDEFDVAAAYGLGEKYLNKGPVTREKILAVEILQNRVLIIDDIWKAPRVEYPQQAWDEGIRMMLDVPLTVGTQIIGLIRIYLAHTRRFSEEELSFVVSIAEQCACAINKTRLIEIQRARYDHLALQTEKMSSLGRMAAGIAHEINNPLAGILLFSSRLSKQVPEEGSLKEGLNIIVRETVRCKSIIQELLEFSRDKEPQMELKNVNDIIAKALSILENEFKLHHILIEKHLSDSMQQAFLDENQIEQVFVNLLLNAIQATAEKGRIAISSRIDPDQNCIHIDVEDNGSGIPAGDMSKIFEPFFSTKPKGTGLGLAVSYGIVKNHGGDIQVASKTGEGTRFTVELPVRTHYLEIKAESKRDGNQ